MQGHGWIRRAEPGRGIVIDVVIFDDLQAEQDRLEGILATLGEAQWASPSQAAGVDGR
jgi:hypothetical protein